MVPHSSTNTSRLASILSATITRQAALSHSSRSESPTDASMSVKSPEVTRAAQLVLR
jgi:hypothetical protein